MTTHIDEIEHPRRGQGRPAAHRLQRPVDPAGRRRRRRPAEPDPLPLRLPAEPRAGRAGRGERRAARAPAAPVRRRDAAVAAVGAGLRLPRRRPAVGLRARAAGDDRRRLVRRARSPRPCATTSPAGSSCSPTRRRRSPIGSAISARSRRRRSRRSSARCSSGIETMILLGFDEETMPCRSALRRSASSSDAGGAAMRARQPDVEGRSSSATGSRSATRCSATRRRRPARRSCCCRRGRSSTPASGSCRCRTSPATSGWSSTTDRATAGPDRTTDPARYTFDAYAADAAAVLDECGVERAVVVGVSLGVAVRAAARRRSARISWPDSCSSAPALPLAQLSPDARRSRRPLPRPGAGVTDRLGSLQPRLLARPLRRVRHVVLRAGVLRAALDQGASRTPSAGRWSPDPSSSGPRRASRPSAVEGASLLDGRDLPDARSSTAPTTGCSRTPSASRRRELTGGAAGLVRRVPATSPTSATRCGSTCCCASSSSGWRREGTAARSHRHGRS